MHKVTPKIFVTAEMQCLQGMNDMLSEVTGARDNGEISWQTTAHSHNEMIVEISGRLCYKSFGTELNKNISKVREGNTPYLANILKTQHGSVIEHAVTQVAFIDVSRIFTHELVRHRQGTAFSQESMRFVRLDDIPMWMPDLKEDFMALEAVVFKTGVKGSVAGTLQATYEEFMERITRLAEEYIAEFTEYLDKPGVPFSLKKKITSALRRMAPSGHATNIIMTANHRAWRFMIQQRTNASAEIEIRKVFEMVAKDFADRYPALYQDMRVNIVEGIAECTFENHKV